MTELIIWGIREGFESKPMFCSNPSILNAFSNLMQDVYRPIANNIRPKNAFIIRNQSGFQFLSLIYSDIREYRDQSDSRWGYVVFTLAIPQQYSFVNSPLNNLIEIATFYKNCVANTNRNNFSDEQIKTNYLNKFQLKHRNTSQSAAGYGYTYFDNQNEIANWICLDKPYVNFIELLFLPNGGRAYEDYQFESKHVYINLPQIENIESKKSENEMKINSDVKQKQDEILALINSGKNDLAISIFENYQYKDRIDNSIRHKIKELLDKKINGEILKRKVLEDEQTLLQIKTCLNDKDWKLANVYYEKLNDKSILDRESILLIKNKIAELNKQKEDDFKKQKAIIEKQKKKKTIYIFSLVSIIIIVSAILIFIKFNSTIETQKKELEVKINEFNDKVKIIDSTYSDLNKKIAAVKDSVQFSKYNVISDYYNPFSQNYYAEIDSLNNIYEELKKHDSISKSFQKIDSDFKKIKNNSDAITKSINKLYEIHEKLTNKESIKKYNSIVYYIVKEDSINAIEIIKQKKDACQQDPDFIKIESYFNKSVNSSGSNEVIASVNDENNIIQEKKDSLLQGSVIFLDDKIFETKFKTKNKILGKYIKFNNNKYTYCVNKNFNSTKDVSANETLKDLDKIFGTKTYVINKDDIIPKKDKKAESKNEYGNNGGDANDTKESIEELIKKDSCINSKEHNLILNKINNSKLEVATKDLLKTKLNTKKVCKK
jgi:hypothetical protein